MLIYNVSKYAQKYLKYGYKREIVKNIIKQGMVVHLFSSLGIRIIFPFAKGREGNPPGAILEVVSYHTPAALYP